MERGFFFEKLLNSMDRQLIEKDEIKKIVSNLIDDNKLYSFIFDSLEEGIILCDPEDEAILYNKKGMVFFDRIRKEKVTAVFPPELAEAYERAKAKDSLKNIILPMELVKNSYLLEFNFFRLQVAPWCKHILIVFYDVNAKIKEEQYNNISRVFANLMEISYSVAHEIRNPLTALSLKVSEIKAIVEGKEGQRTEEFRGGKKEETSVKKETDTSACECDRMDDCGDCRKEIAANVSLISSEIFRLNRILDNFLTSARPMAPRFAPVNVNEILRTIYQNIHPEFQIFGKSLILRLKEDLEPILSDAGLLKQVVINLLKNALDAVMSVNGGEVRISTWDDEENLYIEVHDNGPGIGKDVLPKIFNPFFTTKANGSGLGLTIVYNILLSLSADIKVETKEKGGVAFRIVFEKKKARASLLQFEEKGAYDE